MQFLLNNLTVEMGYESKESECKVGIIF